MSIPTITERINGYEFVWATEKLTIIVSRLHIHTDGRVIGELLIKSALVGNKPFVPPFSFNFISEPARSKLIKSLTASHPQWQWFDIINQLCSGVADMARVGEPLMELWTYEDAAPPEFLLEPILYKDSPTIIFGEKAVAKSTLAILIYICLILPWRDNPLGWKAPDRSVKTLLLDFEVNHKIAHYGAKRIQQGMGLPDFPLYYRRCSIPLVQDLEQIQRHIEDLKAEAIIVDSLGPAVGGELKDPGQALAFTSALRQLKVASLILGQTSKDTETKRKSIYGSVFFEYYARNIFKLRKVQEEGEEKLGIALFHKYCNLGKRHPPMGFQLNFNGEHTTIEPQPVSASEFLEQLSLSQRIAELLNDGALSLSDIADITETSKEVLSTTLGRMRARGQIVKIDSKRWGLVSSEKEE